jgi:amino acid transporter
MNSTVKSLIVSVLFFGLILWITSKNGNAWGSVLSSDAPMMLFVLLFICFGVIFVWVKTTFFDE